VLAHAAQGLRFTEHMDEEDGPLVFAHACKLGLEGIVSKRRDSFYNSGRSPHWTKTKNPAVVGVIEPTGGGDCAKPEDQPHGAGCPCTAARAAARGREAAAGANRRQWQTAAAASTADFHRARPKVTGMPSCTGITQPMRYPKARSRDPASRHARLGQRHPRKPNNCTAMSHDGCHRPPQRYAARAKPSLRRRASAHNATMECYRRAMLGAILLRAMRGLASAAEEAE
jgi:hypothetical protein